MIVNVRRLSAAVLAGAAAAWLVWSPAQARHWKPDARGLASDYAEIFDTRNSGQVVAVIWYVPQMAPVSEEGKALLDKYVVIGIVHGMAVADGRITFADINELQATDLKGTPLKPLKNEDVPPELAGFLVGLEQMLRQSIGAMGEGIRFFAFEGGDVHACAKGGLSVPYNGEVYTYETPIPGCPAQ